MYEILIVLGTASSISMALAPMPAIRDIIKASSVGDFSVFPYIATFCQCLLWITYAGIAEGKHGLYPSNILVGTIEGIYCVIFLKFAGDRFKPILTILVISVITVSIAIGVSIHATAVPSDSIGLLASASNLLMYAAPLAIVKTVVETQSVEYMPFLLSFVGTIASIVWTAWGAAVRDEFVLIPNAIGIALGLIQLGVYFKYRNVSEKRTPPSVTEEASTVETSPLIR